MNQHIDFDSISDHLRRLIAEAQGESVTVRWLLEGLRKRAFGFLLLFLAIPNVIPMPPGLSTLFGTLLLFPSLQLLAGLDQPWFPDAISRQTVKVSMLRAVVDRAGPWLDRVEPLTHERLAWLTERPTEQVIGAVTLILAVILMLPIFLGNLLPGLAICFLAIGMIQRDGIFVLLSLPLVAASLLVAFLNYKLLVFFVTKALGFIGFALAAH